MIPSSDLEAAHRIKNRILGAAGGSVQRILFHGSRVAGRARENSDFDILVVMRDPVHDCVGEALHLSELFVDFEQPVDIQVWGAEEFEECRPVPATIAYPADRHGIVLYADA
ncbi:MAG TPA: nucleotidyltransferase domain-containing protein [Longimicrobium sp.]|nr:nucleotidyltransferase domain-containing protein [Longimicrobium sp.]